jgi:rhomboid family GlyGly-CTERM serine protease
MVTTTTLLNVKPSVGWPVLVVVSAFVVYVLPGVGTALVYDRSAILSGELWRLVTCHWVHFSVSHLFYDVTVLGITGWIIESRGYRYFAALCLLSALSISFAMLALLPDMAFYGGVSGIAMASTVYLALQCLCKPAPWRWVGLSILFLCVGKLIFEAFIGHFILVPSKDDWVVVPLSHLVGTFSGLIMYLWSAMNRLNFVVQRNENLGEN